ncbi:DUF192 domain-containing protein [Pseudidiomarina mangrovi]|uniref:DUF192 domain-containing protein n=1 Tax=Pseudidiomarina mangrovi TaxID=2487133 RepID=UPI000FCA3F1C|nr:DUF192 domain-containing protein [Pseudidiomarina mangrovi]
MKQGRFLLTESNRLLWSDVWVMESLAERYYGLRKFPNIPVNRAFWFPRCQAVHSFTLRVALDVIGLNDAFQIVAVRRNLRPWQALRMAAASSIIECEAGSALPLEYWLGKQVRFQHKDANHVTS